MKCLATFIVLGFAATLHPSLSSKCAPIVFRKQFLQRVDQKAAVSAHESALKGNSLPCIPLKVEKPEKKFLPPGRAICFTMEVHSGEAAQLLLDQPEDLEMQLIGGPIEKLVDSFDIGVETVTIAVPGTYRVEVRGVKPSIRPLALSIVQWNIDLQKSAVWEQAEAWATTSKKSGEIVDVDKSLSLWVALDDASSIARTYLKLGLMLSKKSDPANARVAFEKALELCRANFDTRCSAEAENNSGQMSSRLGDFNAAQQRFEEATRDWRKLADGESEGATLSNLGLMQLQVGNFGQGVAYLDEAKGLLQNRNLVRYAQTLNNLGLCYQNLSEYGRARDYFESALTGFIHGKSLSNLVLARMNLGRNYMLEGNLRRAQQILELAAAEAEKLPGLQPRADTLRNLAQNLYRQGRFDEARSRLDPALDVDRATGNRRGQSSALHYLGLIAEKDGDIATATSLLTEATRLRLTVGLRNDAVDSLFELARLEYHAGHLDAARDFTEQALPLLESVRSQTPSPTLRAFYYSRKQQLFDLLVEIAMPAENPNATRDGLLASERGRSRALMDLLASGSLPGPFREDMAAHHANNQRQLDYLSTLLSQTSPGKDADLRLRFQKLLDDDEALEDRIRKALAEQQQAQPLTSIEGLQRELLSAGSTLLEYHLGERQSYLWIVDAQQVRVFILPPAATIESEAKPVIAGFGHILERRRSPVQQTAYKQALKKLSLTLLGQLSGVHLPERLIFAPDGILHKIPFAALQLPDSVERLGLAYDFVQIPSAAYLLAGARPRPVQQFPQTLPCQFRNMNGAAQEQQSPESCLRKCARLVVHSCMKKTGKSFSRLLILIAPPWQKSSIWETQTMYVSVSIAPVENWQSSQAMTRVEV